MKGHRRRLAAALATGAAVIAAGALAACGDDDKDTQAQTTTAQAGAKANLAAVKSYLLAHTERLQGEANAILTDAERYDALAKGVDYDYARLLRDHGPEVRTILTKAKADFRRANPAYEEMEGVVAGVPQLADYDVIIDAGGDASDPENAVPFSLKTADGRTFKQPGNLNYLIETSLFGTEPKFAAKGARPDLDGDGKVEFGEGLPDAPFFLAAAKEFDKNATELDAAAREWKPTPQDAFTALVVMTPTMSEYFQAWKNSRFVAGDKATEKAFVVTSRLQDIADILGGLELVYANVRPRIASVNPQQAEQTGESLKSLRAFALRLKREEDAGRKFTPAEADTLGSEAQRRAEAIAGQISQAAGRLNIELET